MIRIEHIALWTEDIGRLASFYATYFGASVGEEYRNINKGFTSRFLTFETGARLELMQTTMLDLVPYQAGSQCMGLTHFAVSIGSESAVDQLTEQLKTEGYTVVDGPRWTGDGYYETVVLDPDGNRIEITV